MTHNDPSEISQRSVYDRCDPQYLRNLREAAGMDLVVLARIACLSVAQVRQLESDGSDTLFYSDAIKRKAYHRLLMILGADPPTVEVPQALRDAHQVAEAHKNSLEQIVAMSHQPSMDRSVADTWRAGLHHVLEHKQVLGACLFLIVAVVLFVGYGPQHVEDAKVSVSAPAVAVQVPKDPEPVASAVAEVSAVVPSASVPTVPVTPEVVVAAPVVAPSPNGCAYSNELMPELTSFVAKKEGRYVYLASGVPAEICVVDGNKQVTKVQMKAGESLSVYGVSPWQISGPQLPKVQVYFQGGRVSLPETATRVKLMEVPIAR
jgi:hypothetical protein